MRSVLGCIILWSHDQSTLPIGRATKIGVEGGRLVTNIQFGSTRLANAVEKSVKSGVLNAVSVGFRPLRWKFSNDDSRDRGVDFFEQELLEISLVNVPANSDALLVGSTGIPKSYKEKQRDKRQRDLELAKIKAARNLSQASIDAGLQRLLELEAIRLGGRRYDRRRGY